MEEVKCMDCYHWKKDETTDDGRPEEKMEGECWQCPPQLISTTTIKKEVALHPVTGNPIETMVPHTIAQCARLRLGAHYPGCGQFKPREEENADKTS